MSVKSKKRIHAYRFFSHRNETFNWEFALMIESNAHGRDNLSRMPSRVAKYLEVPECNVEHEDLSCATGRTWSNPEKRKSFIWIHDRKLVWTLAHECLHAVHSCLEQSGVIPDFHNDECEANLLSEVVSEFMRNVKDADNTDPKVIEQCRK